MAFKEFSKRLNPPLCDATSQGPAPLLKVHRRDAVWDMMGYACKMPSLIEKVMGQ